MGERALGERGVGERGVGERARPPDRPGTGHDRDGPPDRSHPMPRAATGTGGTGLPRADIRLEGAGLPRAGTGREGVALPYTVLSCCISLDGYIGSATGGRLLLSNAADFDRVDAVRAGCDAILVGAQTIRSDNPRLLVRDPERRAARRARGLPETPTKVTVTSGADLDPDAAFFTTGADRLVYCPSGAVPRAVARLGARATIVDAGPELYLPSVSADLARRGMHTLLVEGGGRVLTQFLVADIADELHLVVAPVFVGDGQARRFVDDGRFPWHPARRGRLAGVQQIGDVAFLTYALSDRFVGGTEHEGSAR
ncbi:dihydrofolate reductase family protein [Intrasporangium sp.]|uniref:RibD family protein n=1 Tax=Intrasporangium sp. TaxID=1925024 RepID=UPI0032216502